MLKNPSLGQGQQIFLGGKGKMVNNLSFEGHTAFVQTLPSLVAMKLCHCSTKAAVDNAYTCEHGSAPIRLYL